MKRLLLAALLALPASAAAAPSVFVNGIDVTGIYGLKLTDVTVVFDADGNISIDAPNYRIVDQSAKPADPAATKVVTPPADVPAAPPPPQIHALPADSSPTWLVATFNAPGLLGYEIAVYINGAFVTTIPQGNAKFPFDVSSFLRKGKNTIQYRMIMAADSGTASKATVEISLAKQAAHTGGELEVIGSYAPILIKGADGAKTYDVEVSVP